MASFNRVIMVGNLTRDPDYKLQASGQGVCRLSLASNRQYKNRQTGMMVQDVCYIDVDVWGNQAESCNQYLQKGRPVLVEGRLKYDTWESDGQIKRRHSIVADRVVFLGYNTQSENVQDNNKFASESNNKSDQKRVAAKKLVEKSAVSEEGQQNSALFSKDEPPFEDDLPF